MDNNEIEVRTEYQQSLDEARLLEQGLPSALVKAIYDSPFDYACCLRDGTVLRFESVSYEEGSAWIHIDGVTEPAAYPFNFERGLDVRIADLMWVCDAPYGS